jgi:hypothetical protein
MGVKHSPKNTNVNLSRGGRTNRLAPNPPVNNSKYTPEELGAMSHEQRLWLAEHPKFWLPRSSFIEDSDNNFRDPLESPGGNSASASIADDADTTMTHSDTTAKFKGHATPNTLGLAGLGGLSVTDPPSGTHARRLMVTNDANTSCLNHLHSEATRQAALEGITSHGRYETNVGRVFKDWSFTNCPRYNGSVEINVKRWLGTLAAVLDSRQAHPDVWHLVGFRLLEQKAFLDYEDAINSGACPSNWIAFCSWLLELNPLCVSKDSILDDYDKLYQQPNETAQSFFQRFREWQNKAKNYGFHYEASSGFVARLNRGLKEKVKSIVAVGNC